MHFVEVNAKNLEQEHICCALGADSSKKAWLKQAFTKGLRFIKLDARAKVFIEFLPAKHAQKPIEAQAYMLINCLWVSGRYQGQGYAKTLLQKAEEASREYAGLVVVTSKQKKPFLTQASFFKKAGFTVCDEKDGFLLLVKQFKKEEKLPHFTKQELSCLKKDELLFTYTHQCPFAKESALLMQTLAQKEGFETRVLHLDTQEKCKRFASPFASFGLYYQQKLLTHQMMGEKTFLKFLQTLK